MIMCSRHLQGIPCDVEKQVFQLLAVAALLIVLRLLFDISAGVAHVYPRYEALKVISFILLPLTLFFVFVAALICLMLKRFAYGVVLLVLLPIPFLIPRFIDGPYWKFWTNKDSYLSDIQADGLESPRFKIIESGNSNISLGGGVIFEALVYDESGEIARSPELRSSDWIEKRANRLPKHRWFIEKVTSDCTRSIRDFGEHFYRVVDVC